MKRLLYFYRLVFPALLISLSFNVSASLETLTEQERLWLQQHDSVKLAVDIDWAPFEYIDDDVNYVGMAAEYINLVGEKLGVNFEVEKEKPWAEAVEGVKSGELDMFSCVVSTAQRREYVNFTQPYLSFPMVIVTTDNVTYVDGLKDLKNEKVAVVEGYATQDLLEKNYPELELYLAKNLGQALEALSVGKVTAYVGNIASVSHSLKKTGLTNLKISGQTEYKYELSMAVRKDWPEFVPILQKALDSITQQERDRIYQDWIKLRYEYEFDYSLLWQVLGGVFILFLFILLWNRKLSQEIDKRTAVEAELKDAHQRLELGLHGGDLGTWDWNIQTNKVKVNERWFTMLGYPADNLEFDIGFWQKLIHPDEIEQSQNDVSALVNGKVKDYDSGFRLKSASGDYQWIRARGQIVEKDKNGNPLRAAGVHQDISELKVAQLLLEEVNKKLVNYVDIIDRFVITSSTDLAGNITSTSEAFCEISGYRSEELLGQNHRILRHEDMPESLYEDLWSTISSGGTWQGDIKNKKKNGEYYWVQANISPTYNDAGKISGYTAIRQDITDKKRAVTLSITDELTGLFNRRYFNDLFAQEVFRAQRHKKTIALMIMDIDYFKPYNDNYGHQQGDKTLHAVASSFLNTLRRAGDFAFRIGGEEFAGIINVEKPDEAYQVCEKVRKAIEKLKIEHRFHQSADRITVSIGLKVHQFGDGEPLDVDLLYKQADDALYQAKETGRNQTIKFEENLISAKVGG